MGEEGDEGTQGHRPSDIPVWDDSNSENFDVIVVGSGIAGSALAYGLGNSGYKVALFERDLREPDRIVGELLQPGGVLKLRELGLESCIEGIDGIVVNGYAVIMKDEPSVLRYPKYHGDTVLGKSFHHGRFVQKLRKAAATVERVKIIEATVTKLLEEENSIVGVEYKHFKEEAKTLRAPLTVVCDGCGSNLRRGLGLGKALAKSHFVGLVLHDVQLPHPNHGHVFLAEPSPILSYQIGTNDLRILVDVPEPLPKGNDLVEFLKEKTAPQLPDNIKNAFLKALEVPGAIRKMPNSKLHTDENYVKEGVVCIGDAWNMRHPLTGGGMTVALSDAAILKKTLCQVGDLRNRAKVTQALQAFFVERKPLASTINILAFALYQVFSSPYDPRGPSMRQACYGYFQLGGIAVSGPMSLLSGLCPKPFVLLFHFFLVALYGVFQSLKPFPTPARIAHAYRVLGSASWIVIPLMRGEKIFGPFCSLLSVLFPKRKFLTE